MEYVNLIIAIATGLVMWTGTVIGLTLWLHNRFRSLEIAFYRGLGKHRAEIDKKLYEHEGRIQRLEIMTTGSTLAGQLVPPPS